MYSDCIGYLMLSNIDVSELFSAVVKYFPNLQVNGFLIGKAL